MRRKSPTISKNVNKDVVLLRTYNRSVSRIACQRLLQDAIPFSQSSKRIPFFLRQTYQADEICEISINRNLYSKARKSIDKLDYKSQKRLLLNYL